MAISTTYYIDTTIFSTATAVWTEPTLTTKAPDGYYSFEGDYREQVSGLLTDLISCTPSLKEFLISNLSDPINACGLSLPNTVYVSNTNTLGSDTTATSTSIVYTDLLGTLRFIGDGNYYALFCNDLSNTVTTNQRITSVGTITTAVGIC